MVGVTQAVYAAASSPPSEPENGPRQSLGPADGAGWSRRERQARGRSGQCRRGDDWWSAPINRHRISYLARGVGHAPVTMVTVMPPICRMRIVLLDQFILGEAYFGPVIDL